MNQPPPFRRSLAVVIGIDAYGAGIPPLRSAVSDARRLGEILANEHGYEVHSLLDLAATKAALDDLLLNRLPAEVGPDDRVLFYYAGHGVALDGEDGPAGFILPQDAQAADPGTFLQMSAVHEALTALECRHMLVVLDSCFAGAFRWSAMRSVVGPPPVIHRERYDRFLHDPAWQVITSAASDQTAADQLSTGALGSRGEDGVHSPFAGALFQALEGDADLVPEGGDGVITATELYLYLESLLQPETMAVGRRQTPGLWPLRKHGNGEFVFHVPGKEMRLPPAPELTLDNNPYRGLESYREADAELFFGRDEVVADLLAHVESQTLTVVLGASGTGKSSVVRAGLLPRLREDGRSLVLPVMRPGMTPMGALRTAVSTLAADNEGPDIAARVSGWCHGHPGRRLVLVVDQLEELVTLEGATRDRDAFLRILADLLEGHPDQVRIILTVRSDFEPPFTDSPLGARWPGARYVVRPFTQDELRQVIEQPASRRVLFFQPPALVDDLINEVVATPGGLPLLSFALSEMYQHHLHARRGDRAITTDDYEGVGGVVGALRTRADAEYQRMDSGHRATLRNVMVRMVSAEGGNLARRRIPRAELVFDREEENGRVQAVLGALTSARLLVEGQADDGSAFVEPAHDALVRAWGRLAVWLREDDRDESANLSFRHRLTRAAAEWDAENDATKRRGLLWQDTARSAALGQLLRGDEPWLNRRERSFARRSVRSRRRSQLARTAAGVLGFVLAGAATVAALRASASAREASQQALVSQATALGSQAAQETDWTLSLLLSTHALRQTMEAEALTEGLTGRLRSAVYESPLQRALSQAGDLHSRVMYQGPIGWMRQGAHGEGRHWLSPDGRWLVTGTELLFSGSSGCCFDLWDLTEPNPGLAARPLASGAQGKTTVPQVTERLQAMATGEVQTSQFGVDLVTFSADSRWLATGHADSTTQLRSLGSTPSGEPVLRHRHDGPVRAIAIDPGAHWLAATDGTLHVWDLSVDQLGPPRRFAMEDSVHDVAFSGDGRWMATAGAGGGVTLWTLPLGNRPSRTMGLAPAMGVEFSPGGRWLVVYSQTVAILADVLAPESLPLSLQHDRLNGAWVADPNPIRFSPDDRWVVTTGGEDGEAVLHRLPEVTGEVLRSPVDGLAVPYDARFSADSRWLAGPGGGSEPVSLLVDLTQGNREVLPSPAVLEPVSARVFMPGGAGQVEVRDLASGQRHSVPVEEGENPYAVSSDGRWLVTLQGGFYDPSSKFMLRDLIRPWVPAIVLPKGRPAFSADSRWVISQGYDMTRLLDLSDDTVTSLRNPGFPNERIVGGAGEWLLTQPRDSLFARLWRQDRPDEEPVILPGDFWPGIRWVEVEVSADGGWVAATSRFEGGGVWRRQEGTQVMERVLEDGYEWARLTTDGRALATERRTADGPVSRLWDLSSGEPQPMAEVEDREAALARLQALGPISASAQAYGLLQEAGVSESAQGDWSVWMEEGVPHLLDTTRPDAPPFLLDSFPVVNSYDPAFSPDDRWLTIGDYIWDLRGRRPPFPRYAVPGPGEASRLYGIGGFTADSRWAIVVDDQSNEAALCSLVEPDGSELRCARLEDATVGPMLSGTVISPGGHWLGTATRGPEGAPEVLLWNLRATNPAAHALRLPGSLLLGFTEDGGTLLTDGTGSRLVSRWPMDPDSLMLRACRVVGRNLSLNEWARFMGERPYSCTCPDLPAGDGSGRRRCEEGD